MGSLPGLARRSFPLLSTLLLLAFLPVDSWTGPAGYGEIAAEAERHYAEGSYARARELYRKAAALDLAGDEKRWVAFRVADAGWRALAATAAADRTGLDEARAALEAIADAAKRPEEKDRIVAEASESLGDFHWTRREARDFGAAWPRYQAALDWWAGSSDIEAARRRYLAIVFRVAEPPHPEPWYVYGSYGNALPLEVIENALAVAGSDEDRARAHYLMAMSLRHRGDGDDPERTAEEFAAALALGKRTGWYDDALYHFAAWTAEAGRTVVDEQGNEHRANDFVGAVALYRRLLREFAKGETRYHDPAARAVEEITRPTLGVIVSHVFLPGSEIAFHLDWRNVPSVALSLHRIDLAADLLPRAGEGWWTEAFDLSRAETVRRWSHDTKDKGEHLPGRDDIRPDGTLSPGAYMLVAEGGGVTRRELVLVSDAALLVKISGTRVLAFFCDAVDGTPIPGAAVRAWTWRTEKGGSVLREAGKAAATDGDGIALLSVDRSSGNLVVTASVGGRQAFVQAGHHVEPRVAPGPRPRNYVFTDRPAYRPGEEVRWKVVARNEGPSGYETPAGLEMRYVVVDPRGTKVKEGTLRLNDFGAAWDALALTPEMILGEYRIEFGSGLGRGQAVLFRLEEYKLPEFRVTVAPPAEGGRPVTVRPGAPVRIEVAAGYYSGGPVPGAQVEAVVYMRPFRHVFRAAGEHPWLGEDAAPSRRVYGGGKGTVLSRTTTATDASGKATIVVRPPRGARGDVEYTVEARVTDASRREVTGSGTVRATGQRYFASLEPGHRVYRPQDTVSVAVRTVDGNDRPVAASGEVRLVRSRFVEVWIDPAGRDVSGKELEALRAKGRYFPPPPGPDGGPWRPKTRGYVDEEILVRNVATDGSGNGAFSFTPERDGFYRFRWVSERKDRHPVRAEGAVHVARDATADTGYRHGGLEIVVDRESARAGEPLAAMVVAPASGRAVLFALAGDGLESHRLLRLDGTVKLVSVPLEERHVPNVFLSADTVSDLQAYHAETDVVVPPDRNLVDVTVALDRETYEPGGAGTLTVTARDRAGRPVVAEVGLSVADESVFALQAEYAPDPRAFFFGGRRHNRVETVTSFVLRRYARLVRDAQGRLVDERELQAAVARAGGAAPAPGASDAAAMGVPSPAAEQSFARSAMRAEKAAQEAAPLAAAADEIAGGDVVVRSDFRATALWLPDLVTGPDGTARVPVSFPETLTEWRATARAFTAGAQAGMGRAAAATDKPLAVRLQAPRFFTAGDRAVVSAVIRNGTGKPLSVAPALTAGGIEVEGRLEAGRVVRGKGGTLAVPPGGTARADWAVRATRAGTATLTAAAKGGGHADGMEREVPVQEHGIRKLVARAGKVRGDEGVLVVDLPKERRQGATAFTVQVTPSLAATMLDALPYLADYPYGCTEQTMSRFLPAVITARTLSGLGLPPEAVEGRIFGGIEPSRAARSHPEGRKDLRRLDDMVAKGLSRLYDFQHADGGFGWWKEGESDPFMTAYVLWGFSLARSAGAEVRVDAARRAASFLEKEIVGQEESPDLQAWTLHALAAHHEEEGPRGGKGGKVRAPAVATAKAFGNLWDRRDRLNAYGRALLVLSARAFGQDEKARVLLRNLENGVKRDDDPGTSALPGGATSPGGGTGGEAALSRAHWGEDGIAWRWSEGGVEATATALRAIVAVEPGNPLVEPVVNWLVSNRRGAQWSSTRDTAMVVLALNDYLGASGEAAAGASFEVLVNGRRVAARTIAPGEALGAPTTVRVEEKQLRDGANEVRIRKGKGSAPLYVAARADFFSLEEPVAPAGNELFLARRYARLAPRPTLLKGVVLDKVPLDDGGTISSGERVEAILTLEAKNHLEYVVLEDHKPAGFEALEVRSGEPLYARELTAAAVARRLGAKGAAGDGRGGEASRGRGTAGGAAGERAAWPATADPEPGDYTGRRRWVYMEVRDRKAALFLDRLPEGFWEIRYGMRAEVPGSFHALPAEGHAMYVPEIRGNGAEARITVLDREAPPREAKAPR